MRIRHLFTLLLLALGAVFSLPASASVRMVVNGQEQNTYTDLGTALTKFQAGSDDVVEFFCDRTEDLKQAAYVNKAADIVIHVPNIQCFDDYALRVNGKGVRVTLDVEGTFLGNLRVENYGVVTIRNVEYFQGYCEIITEGTLNVEGGNYICINGSTLFDCGDSHAHVCLSGGTFHLDQYQKVVDASADGVTFAEGYGLYDADSGERVLPGIGQSVFGMMQNLVCIPSDDAACISTANYSVAFNSFDMALNASARISSVPFTLTLLKDVKIEPYDWSNETPLYYYGGEVTIDLQGYKLTADFSNAPAIYAEKSSLTLKAAAGGGIVNPSGSILYSNGGSLTVESGNYKAAQNGFVAEDAVVRVLNGEFEAAQTAFDFSACADAIISGGHFLSTGTDNAQDPNKRYAAIKSNGNSLEEGAGYIGSFPGGNFPVADVAGSLFGPNNCAAYNLRVGIGDPCVSVTTNGSTRDYASLASALAAAQKAESAKVTLLQDIEMNEPVELTSGNVTLDFDAYKLTVGENIALDYLIKINGCNFTVEAAEGGGAEMNAIVFFGNKGNLTITGGTFTSNNKVIRNCGSNLNISGGEFTSLTDHALIIENNGVEVRLSGGHFVTKGKVFGALYTLKEDILADGFIFITHTPYGDFQQKIKKNYTSVVVGYRRDGALDVTVAPIVPEAMLVTADGVETPFENFADAWERAQEVDEATIRVLYDCAFTSESYEMQRGHITLEMGEHIIVTSSYEVIRMTDGELIVNADTEKKGGFRRTNEYYETPLVALESSDDGHPHLIVNGGYYTSPERVFSVNKGLLEFNDGIVESPSLHFACNVRGLALILRAGRFIGSDRIVSVPYGYYLLDGCLPYVTGSGGDVYYDISNIYGDSSKDVTLKKTDAVATVESNGESTKFSAIKAALDYASKQGSAKVTLIKDAVLSSVYNLRDADVQLDLGEYTLNCDIAKEDAYNSATFIISNSKLTLSATTGGVIAPNSGLFYCESGGVIIVNSGRYEAKDKVIRTTYRRDYVVITDGTFISHSNCAVLLDFADENEISGGHFIAKNENNERWTVALLVMGYDLKPDYGYFDASTTPYRELQLPNTYYRYGDSYASALGDVVVQPSPIKAIIDPLDGTDCLSSSNFFAIMRYAQTLPACKVTVCRDMWLCDGISLSGGNIILDLDGHTLNFTSTYHGLFAERCKLTICGGGGMTTYGGPILWIGDDDDTEDYGKSLYVTIEGGNYVGGYGLYVETGNVIVNGGTFWGKEGEGLICLESATPQICGGTYISGSYTVWAAPSALTDGYGFYNARDEQLTNNDEDDYLQDANGQPPFYVTVHRTNEHHTPSVHYLNHVIRRANEGNATLDDVNAAADIVLGR